LRDFDPFDRAYLVDPYPALAAIRESSPVLYLEKHGFYLITRYADVVAVSRNHAVFSSTGGVGPEWQPRPMMPMYDPPDHTRLRRMVAPLFLPKLMAQHATTFRDIVSRALDRVGDQPFDLVHEIAEPVALEAIALLLGVPRELKDDFRRWADNTMADLAGGVSADDAVRLEASRREFVTYLRSAVVERRARPGKDVISLLVHASDSERLTDREVVAFCVLLLVAGFEPAASAIGNALRVLAQHPEITKAIPRTAKAIESTTEELFRFDAPVHAFFRNTLADTTVADVAIPKQSKVMIHFGSANRDERVFPRADSFLWDRDPNAHVAFGAGVHYCLGSHLARVELNAVLEVLLARSAGLLPAGREARKDNLLFHCLSNYEARVITP
jgi:cytochrome P450